MDERPVDGSRAFDALISRLEQFREERDWSWYHALKDLAGGIAIEAAELQELFYGSEPRVSRHSSRIEGPQSRRSSLMS